MLINKEIYTDGYYHLRKDIEDFPLAWLIAVWSKRGPGKTYSALRMAYADQIPILYVKRTNDDVELICSGSNLDADFDPSPYYPLNRDFGINVKPKLIKNGLGAFYNCDDEGNPIGSPVSYVLSLNAAKKYKGFDFSICEWLLVDEFIPMQGEIVKRAEGSMLLDLYMTIARDRQKRGRGPLKLILFANAEEISTPITNTLEIVDEMAELTASGRTHKFFEDRQILLHHITEKEVPMKEEEKDGIFKAMAHTSWGRKAFFGEFANNDFSSVGRVNLKHMKAYIKLHHKTYDYFIYLSDNGDYGMCYSPNKNYIYYYDLNKENDQKLFFMNHGIELRLASAEGRFTFQKYSMYDLIINYKKFFKL